MIRWRCKACGFETLLLEELRGQKVKCPKCGAVGQVPGDVVKREGRLQSARKRLQERGVVGSGDAATSAAAGRKRLLAAVLILCAGVAVAVLLWLAL